MRLAGGSGWGHAAVEGTQRSQGGEMGVPGQPMIPGAKGAE